MQVTATFIVLEQNVAQGMSWKEKLGRCTLLEHGLALASHISLIDELVILTDIDELLSCEKVAQRPVLKIWPWAVEERMDFLTCDSSLLYQQSMALEKAGLAGDVHFFLDWRLPLLSPGSWERMYHYLLEDRLAARVVPICPEDPNLYLSLGDSLPQRLMGVWSHPCRDRQEVPQLFRFPDACVAHMLRLRSSQPLTKGLCMPRVECIQIRSPEDLQIASFMLAREQSNGSV